MSERETRGILRAVSESYFDTGTLQQSADHLTTMSTTCTRSALHSSFIALLCASFCLIAIKAHSQEVERVCLPGVVHIQTPDAHGSGFIVSDRGVIVTNDHVVRAWPSYKVTVTTKDNRRLLVSSIKRFDYEYGLDIAILYCEPQSGLTVLPIAPSSPDPGTPVIAIGHPVRSKWVVSKGIVSGIRNQDVLQHDAATNKGNSGGPLIDETGRVVGVIYSVDLDTQTGENLEGMNNAIRPERLRELLESQGVMVSTERLVKSNKSMVDLMNEDVREAQQRLSEDRARLDSSWTKLRSAKLEFDSVSSEARVYNESGMRIRESIESERRDLENKRAQFDSDRYDFNRQKSQWDNNLESRKQELRRLEQRIYELQVPRVQAGVSGSVGYLHMKSDQYGSEHLLYRTEAYLAIRGGTNSDGHGADLYGVSAALTSTSSIEGVSYEAPIATDLSLFVDFAERFRVEAGIGLSNGHPLFNHKNYLFSRIRWNWSSSNSVCYGMYGSAMKSNGSDIIGLSAGLYVGLHVKFLRF